MSEQSATPRTDARTFKFGQFRELDKREVVQADFARDLESALTACQAKLASAEAKIKTLLDQSEFWGGDALIALANEGAKFKAERDESFDRASRLAGWLKTAVAERDSAYETAAKVCDERFNDLQEYGSVSPKQLLDCAIDIRALKHTHEPRKDEQNAAGQDNPSEIGGNASLQPPIDRVSSPAPGAPELPEPARFYASWEMKNGSGRGPVVHAHHFDTLRAAAESLRRDAERYRVLRSKHNDFHVEVWIPGKRRFDSGTWRVICERGVDSLCDAPPAERANILREVSSEWDTEQNDNAVTVHHRMVAGVLCRWWGDGPTPKGVALIDTAAAALSNPTREGWISVKDRLPGRYELVLVSLSDGTVPKGLLNWLDPGWYVSLSDYRYSASDEVTHWQPLPNPPAAPGSE